MILTSQAILGLQPMLKKKTWKKYIKLNNNLWPFFEASKNRWILSSCNFLLSCVFKKLWCHAVVAHAQTPKCCSCLVSHPHHPFIHPLHPSCLHCIQVLHCHVNHVYVVACQPMSLHKLFIHRFGRQLGRLGRGYIYICMYLNLQCLHTFAPLCTSK